MAPNGVIEHVRSLLMTAYNRIHVHKNISYEINGSYRVTLIYHVFFIQSDQIIFTATVISY